MSPVAGAFISCIQLSKSQSPNLFQCFCEKKKIQVSIAVNISKFHFKIYFFLCTTLAQADISVQCNKIEFWNLEEIKAFIMYYVLCIYGRIFFLRPCTWCTGPWRKSLSLHSFLLLWSLRPKERRVWAQCLVRCRDCRQALHLQKTRCALRPLTAA